MSKRNCPEYFQVFVDFWIRRPEFEIEIKIKKKNDGLPNSLAMMKPNQIWGSRAASNKQENDLVVGKYYFYVYKQFMFSFEIFQMSQ